MEGSLAVAHTAARCGPEVVAAFPITPSTHIPQELSRIQPEYGFEFVPVEAEFSAISAILGASAAGARVFTATSSQGLLLMHEVLFNAAGMRLPLVIAVANRAVGAPLNIWNDWQDSVSQRDTGWIQLYCKNNQEALDTLVQAFKIAEKVKIPAMVCFDGFYLTHEVCPVDLPSQDEIAAFLPKRVQKDVLDVDAPVALGCYAMPSDYQEFRRELDNALKGSALVIEEVAKEFSDKFGREQFGLIEEYANDKPIAIVTLGSLAEEAEVVADDGKAGLVRLKCWRPFPVKALAKALEGKEKILIIEKSVSLGFEGALSIELKACLHNAGNQAKVLSAIAGMGGKDVTVDHLRALVERADGGEEGCIWV
jgi:pyruvate ferredoxin oxidoreductase alpha subunit